MRLPRRAAGVAAAAAAATPTISPPRAQGFECRCGQVFCGLHRYADAHACSFDYATHGRAILAKANTRVAGDKGLEKI